MKKDYYARLLKEGFLRGMAWSFGATTGFIIISTVAVLILRRLGGLPFVGNFIASIVESTIEQLTKSTPIFPR